MPDRALDDHLVRELKVVGRAGLHRLREHLEQLPALVGAAEIASGAGTAQHVEGLLRSVWTTRSEGQVLDQWCRQQLREALPDLIASGSGSSKSVCRSGPSAA